MRRGILLLACLCIVIAGCQPAASAEVNAPRIPKGETAEGGSPPRVDVTMVPGGTLEPSPAPFIQRTPFPTWPAPLTYAAFSPPATAVPRPVIPYLLPPDTVNILLIGSDRRVRSTSFRTDVLIVLSIQPSAGGAAMISIPRDLYVYIPGFTMQRINAAYIQGEQFNYPGGGPALLGDTILYNLGIQIHHYARIEMDGFQDLIDNLGGVDVHVACPYTDWRLKRPGLNPEDEDNWALFTTPAGVVHMDGDYALWYARSRKRSSDFDRSRRQQEVLRAAHRQILSLGLLPRLPEVYDDLTRSVFTDLSLSELLQLVPVAGRVRPSQIRSRFIGRDAVTSWKTPTGGQVVLPKEDAIRAIIDDAFDFGERDPLLPQNFITVEILNASSQAQWSQLAAERLEYSGYDAHIGAATDPSSTPTHLIDYGKTDERFADEILSSMGLSRSALVQQPDAASPFPFRLVLGNDYRPCFDPTKT